MTYPPRPTLSCPRFGRWITLNECDSELMVWNIADPRSPCSSCPYNPLLDEPEEPPAAPP